MSKFIGKIGFTSSQETSPGIWEEISNEITFKGEHIKNKYKLSFNDTNFILDTDDIISIVASPYAQNNYKNIKYIVIDGVKRLIKYSEVIYPRIILAVGSEYNGS